MSSSLRSHPTLCCATTPALPPVWTVLEAMTIGQLSRLFSDLHLDHRKTVAAKFGYDESGLVTWLKSLTILRNVCAHHGRLWNASITADALKYAKAKQVLQVLAVFIVFGQMTRASRHSVLNSLFE